MSDYMTMKELGIQLGGMSSHQIGRTVKELGLRTHEGKPSRKAFEQKLVSQRFTDDGEHYLWAWDSTRTIRLHAEHARKREEDHTKGQSASDHHAR